VIIWLVNPFDPLPGDPEQEGRYATLAKFLIAKGHDVIWWTSSFSHRFKKPVNQRAITAVCKTIGIDVRFLSVPAYYRNIGLARLWNHYLLAKRFCKAARKERNLPDVILASAPPPMLAHRAAGFAKQCGAKVIIDIQDLWPETFVRAVPKFLRPFSSVALAPWYKAARDAYKAADAIVGVADAYVTAALELSGSKMVTATIPLGIDLTTFDTAVTKGRCEEVTKPRGQIWFIYAGSLNRSYDCLTTVNAFAKIHKKLKTPSRLFITGRGELRKKIEQIIHEQHLTNITLTGFLDFRQWAYLLSQCDVGFNASFPKAMIYLPNKIFYYFAAGLAVANTIAGECSQIIRQGHCGLDYKAGNVDNCEQAIEQIVCNREKLTTMQHNSRLLAENHYDRKLLYPKCVRLIEQLAET
jgi:glycosyltransferase involved in cell wall biosynthesis